MYNKSKISELIEKKWLECYSEELIEEIETAFSDTLSQKLKKYKNMNRLRKIDEKKDHSNLEDFFTDEEIDSLPSWVKKEKDTAQVIWKSWNVIQVTEWRKYHIKNKLNDLTGWERTFFLNSVISTRYPTSWPESYAHHIRKIHPSPKPPQLMEEIIKFFTKEWEYVLDYFMGVWGTLLWASLSWRKALWIDLSQKYINTYQEASEHLWLNIQNSICGDSMVVLDDHDLIKSNTNWNQFSLILIDPPYWDMMARKKTWEAVKKWKDSSATPFTELESDLWNMDWGKFRKHFLLSVKKSIKLLKNKWHIVVFIKDMQPRWDNLNLLHSDLIHDISSLNWINYLWTKIRADLWVNLYPYWYPYSYVSNQIHQYILIFKKD